MVLDATRPAVSDRLPDVRSFLERLADAELGPACLGASRCGLHPLKASPGAARSRWRTLRRERRLGTGSTAFGRPVIYLTIGDSGPDTTRVLKVAVDDKWLPACGLSRGLGARRSA